jgi:DMSO/TMAO reductase YedYZ molybdopterin-dependent catalytic subunit
MANPPMMIRWFRRWAPLLASALFVVRTLAADPADSVSVTGDVRNPVTLDVAMLRGFPAESQSSVRTSREVDGRQQQTVVRGVRLRAVLEQAALAERDRFDWRKTVVIATARDGYRAVFSWPELVNTEAGAQVIVVYERDGETLSEREGPLALTAPGDVRPGPRHVKWLSRIEVKVLRD